MASRPTTEEESKLLMFVLSKTKCSILLRPPSIWPSSYSDRSDPVIYSFVMFVLSANLTRNPFGMFFRFTVVSPVMPLKSMLSNSRLSNVSAFMAVLLLGSVKSVPDRFANNSVVKAFIVLKSRPSVFTLFSVSDSIFPPPFGSVTVISGKFVSDSVVILVLPLKLRFGREFPRLVPSNVRLVSVFSWSLRFFNSVSAVVPLRFKVVMFIAVVGKLMDVTAAALVRSSFFTVTPSPILMLSNVLFL